MVKKCIRSSEIASRFMLYLYIRHINLFDKTNPLYGTQTAESLIFETIFKAINQLDLLLISLKFSMIYYALI